MSLLADELLTNLINLEIHCICIFVYLQIPKPRLKISKESFSYMVAKVWNDIPNDIRNAESTHLFDQNMKTFPLGPVK